MPYDADNPFHFADKSEEAHAARVGLSYRRTKIMRRALVLRLAHPGITTRELQDRMSDCPRYIAEMSVDELMETLAVELVGNLLIPIPVSKSNPLQQVADLVGTTVPEITRMLGKSSKRLRAQAGIPLCSKPPFGYHFGECETLTVNGKTVEYFPLVVDDEEAEWVVWMYDAYAYDGRSMPEIAEFLNLAEVPTRSGKPWSQENVREILRNPVYTGYILYRGVEHRNQRNAGELFPGRHEAIVSWDLFVDVQDRRVSVRYRRKNYVEEWECPWEGAPE